MQTFEISLPLVFKSVLRAVAGSALVVLLSANSLAADSPIRLLLDPTGHLQWTGGPTNGYVVVEHSTNLSAGIWSPVAYDLPFYNRTSILSSPYYLDVATPVHAAQFSLTQEYSGFYRLMNVTNFEETNLLLHFSFENDFPSQGMVLDVSGHGNHGLRYGYPCCPTTNRFPSATVGPDGSQAAEFHYYVDGWGDYGVSGDYIGIPTTADFLDMPQATIAFWCHYYGDPTGCNCNSTPLQAGMGPGAWTIGRYYDFQTTCEIEGNFGSSIALSFPDRAPDNDTGGWHHYAVTFDHGVVLGFFDGTNCDAGFVPVSALSVVGPYLTLGGWTFSVDPWLNEDGHPNNAWINGALDDVRIYDRVLSPGEMLALYASFDKLPPGAPQGLTTRVDSSTQIELSWQNANDNFRVDGYQLIRNGIFITNVIGTHYVDSGLVPLTTYSYLLKAYDPAGNISPSTPTVTTNTPAAGSGVEVVVDDAQGPPWADVFGNWNVITDPNPPNFYDSGYHAGFSTRGAVSVTFRPVLPESGNYQVYIWNPGSSSYSMWVFSSVVPVDVVSGTGTNTISVNEQINYATWNYLGTYAFAAGTNGFVRVRTSGTSGDVVSADAVRFVK
jgi:hypothetical protein